MRAAILAALLLACLSAADDGPRSSELPESTTELLKTVSRQARQLNIPAHEYPNNKGAYSHARQIIKIPSNARIKVVQAQPNQSQHKPARGSRVTNLNNAQAPSQNRPRHQVPPSQQPPQRPKRPFEDEDYFEDEYKYPKKPRKTKNGYMVQDVSPEEFYEDDEFDYFQRQKHKKPYSYVQASRPEQHQKKKHRKQEHDANPQASNAYRRPMYDDESGYEFNRIRHRDRSPAPSTYFDDDAYAYEDYAASSAITMKQVPPPNLALNVVDPPDLRKESHTVKKQMNSEYFERFPTEPTPLRKPPTNRQMQSMFPQHYTTHNPYVTRNLGLDDHKRTDWEQQEYEEQHAAASDQRPALIPTGSSGIHIVKPPQFHENVVGGGQPHSGQRATIRDILKNDCPDAEDLGYCASPPRYPTQQINQIMVRCAEMIDSMYAPAPIDPEDDLTSFSSRSDEQDIEFVDEPDTSNKTIEKWGEWSRSDDGSSNTMCSSLLTQTEPGYAKEVTSGRWFVIMQTMDSIVQRVMTDTCQRVGKPCGGLAGLKCSRGSHPGYKSTRCVQRHTQHRLISWDPETPQLCPKVRVFRFPTACLCHLSAE